MASSVSNIIVTHSFLLALHATFDHSQLVPDCISAAVVSLQDVVHAQNTVYHESFEAENFHGFHSFYMVRETFYMKVQDGALQIWN